MLYGERSVVVGSQDSVIGGDIGVAAATVYSFGPQLSVGSHSQAAVGHNLLSPSMTLASQTQVGDVQTNSLTNQGATIGKQGTYPAASMP